MEALNQKFFVFLKPFLYMGEIVLIVIDQFLSGVEKEFQFIVDMALSVVVVEWHFVVKHILKHHQDALQVKVRLYIHF